MDNGGLKKVLGHLRQALLPPDGGGLSDGQLLGRFVADREEAAFAALVWRHGPMVLGVCRRVLGHAQDAEDAFQAAFLVLARKAASVVKREALASWLYGVAYRAALRVKARAQKRRATERQVEDMPHPLVTPPEAQDWRPLLDRELDLLPQRYRTAVILCDLQGKTRRQAALQLGLSEGTLSSRLARARCLLARRLARHGLALSGGALALGLSEGLASAQVPAALIHSTVKAAALVAAGQSAMVATPVAVLTKEVLKTMFLAKVKLTVAALVVLLGTGGLVYQATGLAPVEDRSGSGAESLRRENELLKLNIQVLLEKIRAQEAELLTLKGGAATPEKVAEGAGGTAKPSAANIRHSQNNLKQLALAFHNYADAYGHFPPAAVCDATGKPLLSWRVAILPFLEQDKLYKQFHLDESWDSEHNKKLLDQMPDLYSMPGARFREKGLTAYQVFVGKGALFDGGRKSRLADITDGASNTVMMAEAAAPVPWTKPADIPFGEADPRTQVGGYFGNEFNVSMCDGSVRKIDRKKVSQETFRNAIMPADGNVLGSDW